MPCCYLNPEKNDFNKIPELQVCIAEALYDVDSIVAVHGINNPYIGPEERPLAFPIFHITHYGPQNLYIGAKGLVVTSRYPNFIA